MKEGGEIIDMIDYGSIKDLQFVTHTFSNDANGKMLLGMAFVMSISSLYIIDIRHYSSTLPPLLSLILVSLSFACEEFVSTEVKIPTSSFKVIPEGVNFL